MNEYTGEAICLLLFPPLNVHTLDTSKNSGLSLMSKLLNYFELSLAISFSDFDITFESRKLLALSHYNDQTPTIRCNKCDFN